MVLISRLLKYENKQCFPIENEKYRDMIENGTYEDLLSVHHDDILISIYTWCYFISAVMIKKISNGPNDGQMSTYLIEEAILSDMDGGYRGETQEELDRFTEHMIQEINKGRYLEKIEDV